MVLCLKKRLLGDELLTLALLLSLLRPEGLELHSGALPVTTSGLDLALQSSVRRGFGELGLLAPGARGRAKTLLLDPQQYQEELLEELLSLGRFDQAYNSYRNIRNDNNHNNNNRWHRQQRLNERVVSNDVTAFLLTISTGNIEPGPATPAEGEAAGSSTQPAAQLPPSDELTPEDMALIEVLWKQDVDLGIPLDVFSASAGTEAGIETAPNLGKETTTDSTDKPDKPDDNEPASPVNIKGDEPATSAQDEDEDEDGPLTSIDPWAGLPYTIDLETGEYVLCGPGEEDSLAATLPGDPGDDTSLDADEASSALPAFDNFSLEEALKIVGLDDKEPLQGDDSLVAEVKSEQSEEQTEDEEFAAAFSDMMQTHQHNMYLPHHHPGHRQQLQGRVPLVRAVSMEQRWQDLAQLLTGPPPPNMPPIDPSDPHSSHFQQLLPPQPPGGPSFPPHAAAYPHHPDHRGVLLHNATLAPPMGDLNATSAYTGLSAIGGSSSHLGNAVATSMNLTNSSEPMGGDQAQGYKMEPGHDMMYYQVRYHHDPPAKSYQQLHSVMNGTASGSEQLNQTADGFLSSILNDEDLQLMDMAMNEGMYTMRLLENAQGQSGAPGLPLPATDGDGSSDSAVSSMGSERGGAWGLDPAAHNASSPSEPGTPYLEYGPHAGKYRGGAYDYSYAGRQPNSSSVAQKKHHMFGKRFFQEQHGSNSSSDSGLHAGAASPSAKMEMKFSCSLEFARHHAAAAAVSEPRVEHVTHNHTYHLPSLPESTGAAHRPLTRDKGKSSGRRCLTEEEHISRDEKRARAMNVPITVEDIINLPMDEFNERLSKYDLTEPQLSLIRDIRRRGKNKVAAQNCRKRKLDQILSLADEVKLMRDRKNRLLRDKESMLSERQRLKEKFSQLYRHVFQALRDPEGRPYSPYEYSLQQSADGSVLLVPRGAPSNLGLGPPNPSPPEEPPKAPHQNHHHQRRHH